MILYKGMQGNRLRIKDLIDFKKLFLLAVAFNNDFIQKSDRQKCTKNQRSQ